MHNIITKGTLTLYNNREFEMKSFTLTISIKIDFLYLTGGYPFIGKNSYHKITTNVFLQPNPVLHLYVKENNKKRNFTPIAYTTVREKKYFSSFY